jgi:hypothetical protein
MADLKQWTGGKQRLTATRLHELLVADRHQVDQQGSRRDGNGNGR